MLKEIKKKIKEYYPPEPFKRAFYVSGGCSCSGCLTGLGHIIGYFKYEK